MLLLLLLFCIVVVIAVVVDLAILIKINTFHFAQMPNQSNVHCVIELGLYIGVAAGCTVVVIVAVVVGVILCRR